jgi:hypothetical protein
VYVGAISSLSFLEFVRQVLRRCMGSSSFTENELNDIMLEIDPNEQAGSSLQAFGTADDLWGKEGLIQTYFEVVSAIKAAVQGPLFPLIKFSVKCHHISLYAR